MSVLLKDILDGSVVDKGLTVCLSGVEEVREMVVSVLEAMGFSNGLQPESNDVLRCGAKVGRSLLVNREGFKYIA